MFLSGKTETYYFRSRHLFFFLPSTELDLPHPQHQPSSYHSRNHVRPPPLTVFPFFSFLLHRFPLLISPPLSLLETRPSLDLNLFSHILSTIETYATYYTLISWFVFSSHSFTLTFSFSVLSSYLLSNILIRTPLQASLLACKMSSYHTPKIKNPFTSLHFIHFLILQCRLMYLKNVQTFKIIDIRVWSLYIMIM